MSKPQLTLQEVFKKTAIFPMTARKPGCIEAAGFLLLTVC